MRTKVVRRIIERTPQSLRMQFHVARSAWRDRSHAKEFDQRSALPIEAEQYLRRDNPKLLELQRRYSQANAFTHTFWERRRIELKNFRGEGRYLAQGSGQHAKLLYFAQTVYLETADDWGLLDWLVEDDLFGCHTFPFAPRRTVSRDLLDSILEITFLRRALTLNRSDEIRVLDIGAGYGRFAHRFAETFPNAHINNIDGVPESTFLCDFYTRFRGIGDRSTTVAADEVDKLNGGRFDIATNIHSWSECSRATVRKWMETLRNLRVPMLFVVPHDAQFTSQQGRGSDTDTFLPEIIAAGYREVLRARKFPGSETLHGLQPVLYTLFELKNV